MRGFGTSMHAPFTDLRHYATKRDTLLDRITRLLEADTRVIAAWLSGSFGRGEADAWSDLDLHIAVDDPSLSGFLQERMLLYERVGHILLVQQDMPSNSMPGGRYQLVLYADAIEIDWNIGAASQAVLPVASQMLFARTNIPVVTLPALTPSEWQAHADKWLVFFWAMAPIAVKYAGRAETRRAVHQIDLLTTAFISLWRLIHQPEGPDPHLPTTNRELEAELDALLPRLGATIDPAAALAVIDALCAEVERLHPNLAMFGVSIPSDVPRAVARLRILAEATIKHGEQPRRKYR